MSKILGIATIAMVAVIVIAFAVLTCVIWKNAD